MKQTVSLGLFLLLVLFACESSRSETCPETKVVNRTNEWNETDQRSLGFAHERCEAHFPDSPCLKTFEKREENVYRATCGAPEGR